MLSIKKVLFPTDFSVCSQEALGHAMLLAEQFDAELQILHITTLHGGNPDEMGVDLPEALLQKSQELEDSALASLLEPCRDRPLRVREFRQRALYAGPAILSHIEREEIDIVVMGTHGRRGWTKALLGSVAEEIIRYAPCPVLALRYDESQRRLESIDDLVVPIDFSMHSRAAMLYAVELARVYDAKLHLLHAIHHLPVPAFYSPMLGSFEESAYPEIAEKAREELQRWADELAPGVPCEVYAERGDTSDCINALSDILHSQMTVMATHGLTGFKHWLLGSHTERVLRYTNTPLLVVKSFGRGIPGVETT